MKYRNYKIENENYVSTLSTDEFIVVHEHFCESIRSSFSISTEIDFTVSPSDKQFTKKEKIYLMFYKYINYTAQVPLVKVSEFQKMLISSVFTNELFQTVVNTTVS